MRHNHVYKTISLLLVLLLVLCSCTFPDSQLFIFETISECDNLERALQNTGSLIVYNSPKEDAKWRELEYDAFWGCQYESKDLTFQLFAYEFPDIQTSKDYFENITGKTTLSTNFSDNTGMHTFRRTIIHNGNAFLVYCPKGDKAELISLLSKYFQINIGDMISG